MQRHCQIVMACTVGAILRGGQGQKCLLSVGAILAGSARVLAWTQLPLIDCTHGKLIPLQQLMYALPTQSVVTLYNGVNDSATQWKRFLRLTKMLTAILQHGMLLDGNESACNALHVESLKTLKKDTAHVVGVGWS